MADKGFLFFHDWASPLRQLSGDEFKELFFAMYDYQTENVAPPAFDGTLGIIAAFVFPQLERRKVSSEAGKAGMQKRWGEGTNKPLNKGVNNKAITQDKDKDKDKDKDEDKTSSNEGGRDEAPVRTRKKSYGEYKNVKLTDEEYKRLQADYPNTDEAIVFLDEYIERKGYKAKSHYLTLRKWVFDALKEQQLKRGGGLEQTHSDADWQEFWELACNRTNKGDS